MLEEKGYGGSVTLLRGMYQELRQAFTDPDRVIGAAEVVLDYEDSSLYPVLMDLLMKEESEILKDDSRGYFMIRDLDRVSRLLEFVQRMKQEDLEALKEVYGEEIKGVTPHDILTLEGVLLNKGVSVKEIGVF